MTAGDPVPVARPSITDDAVDNIRAVIDSGRLTGGRFTDRFERRWADYCGTDHAVAVANGTAALQLALEAVDIGPGDRVVVPPLTFGATVAAVLHVGATPVFADVDADTYTLDPAAAERTEPAAVLPVHLFGHPADMDGLGAVAERHDARVIEDAAQAHGAATGGRRAGSLGDVAAFSFYATKNATTAEGGAVTTDDGDLAERVRRLRSHGMTDRDTHTEVGYNYRMSELHAALGVEQIGRLDAMNAERRRIAEDLLAFVDDDVPWAETATVGPGVTHAYFWAPIEVAPEYDGKAVWRALKSAGVETRHRYTAPLYRQPAFEEVSVVPEPCPVAERVAGQLLGLPNHPELTAEQVQRVKDVLVAFEPPQAGRGAGRWAP